MNNRTPNSSSQKICSFEGCGREYSAHGYCQSHNRQQRLGQELKPIQVQLKGEPLHVKFWAKVNKSGPDECWNWNAHLNEHGYGRMRHSDKLHLAHRISFELENGPIDEGLIIDHVCHNPACVNPKHLRAATIKQNAENRFGAQKDNKTGFRGVYPRKDKGDFVAKVKHNGAAYYLGLFPTAEAANEAATAKRLELYTHNIQDRLAA